MMRGGLQLGKADAQETEAVRSQKGTNTPKHRSASTDTLGTAGSQ